MARRSAMQSKSDFGLTLSRFMRTRQYGATDITGCAHCAGKLGQNAGIAVVLTISDARRPSFTLPAAALCFVDRLPSVRRTPRGLGACASSCHSSALSGAGDEITIEDRRWLAAVSVKTVMDSLRAEASGWRKDAGLRCRPARTRRADSFAPVALRCVGGRPNPASTGHAGDVVVSVMPQLSGRRLGSAAELSADPRRHVRSRPPGQLLDLVVPLPLCPRPPSVTSARYWAECERGSPEATSPELADTAPGFGRDHRKNRRSPAASSEQAH